MNTLPLVIALAVVTFGSPALYAAETAADIKKANRLMEDWAAAVVATTGGLGTGGSVGYKMLKRCEERGCDKANLLEQLPGPLSKETHAKFVRELKKNNVYNKKVEIVVDDAVFKNHTGKELALLLKGQIGNEAFSIERVQLQRLGPKVGYAGIATLVTSVHWRIVFRSLSVSK